MLSFYHIRVPASLGVSEQGGQGPQRCEINAGGISHGPRAAGLRLEHPLRDLQHWELGSFVECAPKHGRAIPAVDCLDAYSALGPRVPRVAHFQHVGIMGVRSLGCTIAAAHTPISVWASPSRLPACQCP
jgi:hypothetical protein